MPYCKPHKWAWAAKSAPARHNTPQKTNVAFLFSVQRDAGPVRTGDNVMIGGLIVFGSVRRCATTLTACHPFTAARMHAKIPSTTHGNEPAMPQWEIRVLNADWH